MSGVVHHVEVVDGAQHAHFGEGHQGLPVVMNVLDAVSAVQNARSFAQVVAYLVALGNHHARIESFIDAFGKQEAKARHRLHRHRTDDDALSEWAQRHACTLGGRPRRFGAIDAASAFTLAEAPCNADSSSMLRTSVPFTHFGYSWNL